ncbi:phosphotransferase [Micromonospora fiedleri]|uniref:Phosphotransferase n=1 Tax=Micromonospora fiedleri TaxID=1157498 RepID=A0ABS1UUX8_9ACTN|nr:phosphotransferase [Micromonospora fiedleri]MBL6280167.1 phosphotransferase [Micromonospora fiedleri]
MASETADARVLDVVAAAFGLGLVENVEVIDAGLMNRNWRVWTVRGVFAVKQILDIDATAARCQHAATRALAERGRPVPAPLTTADGDTLLEHAGHIYAAATWARGAHREGLDLSLPEAAALGAVLADLHADLAQVMPMVPETMREPVTEPATTKDKIDRYAAAAAARPVRDGMDEFVLDRLRVRRHLLAQVGHLRPDDDVDVGPCGWVHGDFQHLNVLYADGEVSAVLDWDRLKPRPLAAEVVRSATLLFGFGDDRGLDLARVQAFTAGYRSRRKLPDEALTDAVHRLWWERVCDTWQLRRRYEHADTSCDHLFRSAEALLGWWTAHRPQVAAAFTG